MSEWGYIHYGNCGKIKFIQDKTEINSDEFYKIKQSSTYALS